jgi:protein phosphatase
MVRIGVISDIHGNVPALEATLRDVRTRGVRRVFCLGDLAGRGRHAREAVDICREHCDAVIKGNCDDLIITGTEEPAIRWHQRRLGRERLEYLRALPHTIEFLMNGKTVRLFHASQNGLQDRVYADDPPQRHLAMFSNTEFTGDALVTDVVGSGDTHAAYLSSLKKRTLFNADSVGNPLDSTRASYVILEGSTAAKPTAPSQSPWCGSSMTSNSRYAKREMRACLNWNRMRRSCGLQATERARITRRKRRGPPLGTAALSAEASCRPRRPGKAPSTGPPHGWTGWGAMSRDS